MAGPAGRFQGAAGARQRRERGADRAAAAAGQRLPRPDHQPPSSLRPRRHRALPGFPDERGRLPQTHRAAARGRTGTRGDRRAHRALRRTPAGTAPGCRQTAQPPHVDAVPLGGAPRRHAQAHHRTPGGRPERLVSAPALLRRTDRGAAPRPVRAGPGARREHGRVRGGRPARHQPDRGRTAAGGPARREPPRTAPHRPLLPARTRGRCHGGHGGVRAAPAQRQAALRAASAARLPPGGQHPQLPPARPAGRRDRRRTRHRPLPPRDQQSEGGDGDLRAGVTRDAGGAVRLPARGVLRASRAARAQPAVRPVAGRLPRLRRRGERQGVRRRGHRSEGDRGVEDGVDRSCRRLSAHRPAGAERDADRHGDEPGRAPGGPLGEPVP